MNLRGVKIQEGGSRILTPARPVLNVERTRKVGWQLLRKTRSYCSGFDDCAVGPSYCVRYQDAAGGGFESLRWDKTFLKSASGRTKAMTNGRPRMRDLTKVTTVHLFYLYQNHQLMEQANAGSSSRPAELNRSSLSNSADSMRGQTLLTSQRYQMIRSISRPTAPSGSR